ncbi:DNA polymerase nu-like isoform X2 [Acanthaster planci]|uniref:DNA-directed DNA polymerase n=1 Tax=Acanthaster planci TaxID=133434 RepID=A0A8B7Y018_ACAPL|nr:DNA polymerase nu-like isoform X2 [Acanthaster planci]
MCPVWTPLTLPPSPDEVQALSDDARTILKALREAHRKKREALLQSRAPPDPKTYYRALYRESFKEETPCLNQENSSGELQAPGNYVVSVLGQRSTDESSPRVSCRQDVLHREQSQGSKPSSSGVGKDSHRFPTAASQDDVGSWDFVSEPFPQYSAVVFCQDVSKTSRADKAESYCGTRVRHPVNASSNSHQAGLSQGSPSRLQEAIELGSCILPDSPPIDTRCYQEFNKTRQNLPSPNLDANPAEQGRGSDVAKFRKTPLEDFPNDRAWQMSPDTVEVKRPRLGLGNVRDSVVIMKQVPVGTTPSGASSDAGRPLPQESCSPRRVHLVGDSVGEVGVTWVPFDQRKKAGTGLSAGCKSNSTSVLGSHSCSDVKVGSRSHHGLPAQPKVSDSSTSRTNEVLSGAQMCNRKADQPTVDEFFGFSGSALHGNEGLIRNVASMTPAAREEVGDRLSRVDEVSMCLVYKDGSSQLREPDHANSKIRGFGCNDSSAEWLVLAYDVQQPSAKDESVRPTDVDGTGKHPGNRLEFISVPVCGKRERPAQEWSKEMLLRLMGNDTVKKICFDAQEMIHTLICSFSLDHATVSSNWLVMDPKVAAWLIDADHPPITFSDLLGKYLPNQASRSETRMSSTCSDLSLLGAAMKRMFYMLSEAGLWQLFLQVEMRLCPILAVMEVQGICVNSQTLEEYGKLLQSKSQQVEKEAHKAAGCCFQITSHTQLRQVLFEELQLDKKYHGRKLARTNVLNLKSTSETVLLKLQDLHPLPKLVLQYRQLAKLKSTYVDGILDCIEDGCIHTSWEHTVAATGRLQSAEPNIQNIPKQPVLLDSDGTQADTRGTGNVIILARKPFVSRNDWSFIAADFQSIELRLLAHLSHDPVLVRAFNKKDCTDIFVELASQWVGVPTSSVTSAEREKTKRIVYSVIYGVGPDKLAETLSVSREEAKTFTKSFLGTFRGVHSFTRACTSCCQQQGFIQTILRRRRLIPSINASEFHARSHAERQCVNFVVQGSAADICKVAMIQVVRALAARPDLKARLLVQIHDELLLEVADSDVGEVKGLVKSAMEVNEFHCGVHAQLQVPLPVSISVGKNWGQLECEQL